MTKNNREINLFDISQIKNRNKRSDKIKTTNINILLNRVTISRKTEFKKNNFFISFNFKCKCSRRYLFDVIKI